MIKLKTKEDLMRFLIPFINEICNVLTIAFPVISIYAHHPSNTFETLSKTAIDFIALFGIIWNAVYTSHKYNNQLYGIIKGCVIVLVAFIIPNLFTIDFINYATKLIGTDTAWIKLITGIIFIFILLILEIFLYDFIIKTIIKYKIQNTKNINP